MDNQTDNVSAVITEHLGQVGQSFSGNEHQLLKSFFEIQSERIQTSFRANLQESDDMQRYLLRHTVAMKELLTQLQQPWDKFIPILNKGATLWVLETSSENTRRKALEITSAVMACAAHLTKSGRLINGMANFYHRQACDLKQWIAQNEEQTHMTGLENTKPL